MRSVSTKAPIQISGRPISAIIDTGAEVTVLSHKVFEQILRTDKPEIRKTGRSLMVAEDEKQIKIKTSFAAPVRQPMRPVPKIFEEEELSHLQE